MSDIVDRLTKCEYLPMKGNANWVYKKLPPAWVREAKYIIEDLRTRVAELEAERDALLHDLPRIKDSETDAINRAEAAEALLVEAVKAGMMEARQQAANLAVRLVNGSEEMTDVHACRTIAKDIRALASDPETIARIVAQLKEGRG